MVILSISLFSCLMPLNSNAPLPHRLESAKKHIFSPSWPVIFLWNFCTLKSFNIFWLHWQWLRFCLWKKKKILHEISMQFLLITCYSWSLFLHCVLFLHQEPFIKLLFTRASEFISWADSYRIAQSAAASGLLLAVTIAIIKVTDFSCWE